MNIETRLLNRIKAAQAEYAIQALKLPGEKREFDFGFRCGYTAGLEAALSVLFELVEEDKRDDKDL